MADVLSGIIERKRYEVANLSPDRSAPRPTHRSLRAALIRPGARFIMEVKHRSPSGHRALHSIGQAVGAYLPVADAISVLTDATDFGGSLDQLSWVRDRFDGPILAKDFVVDVRQVMTARSAGADAVLAMMSVLDDSTAADVLAAARGLAMDVIAEVHDEVELERALRIGADIVGINNRDLKTLATDLAVTERIAPLVPPGVLLVAESGIGSRADVERLAPLVDAFLVGSSLMAADDISEAARTLVHGRVKICGLTRVSDMAAVAKAGATHAGVIFHPDSPRRVTVEQARILASVARNAGLKPVGVFRGDDRNIANVAHDIGLHAVQMHGAIPSDLKSRLGRVELWSAMAPDGGRFGAATAGVDRILFDGGPGGTGQMFDWTLLSDHKELPSAILAGGIGPGNIADAAKVGAYCVDLCSGVESTPGIKDPVQVAALFDALRPTCRGEA